MTKNYELIDEKMELLQDILSTADAIQDYFKHLEEDYDNNEEKLNDDYSLKELEEIQAKLNIVYKII